MKIIIHTENLEERLGRIKMPKYKIVVDYGKPYEIKVNSDSQLKKELLKLKRKAEREDHPYFDINIYDEKGKDVTDKMFDKLKINN